MTPTSPATVREFLEMLLDEKVHPDTPLRFVHWGSENALTLVAHGMRLAPSDGPLGQVVVTVMGSGE